MKKVIFLFLIHITSFGKPKINFDTMLVRHDGNRVAIVISEIGSGKLHDIFRQFVDYQTPTFSWSRTVPAEDSDISINCRRNLAPNAKDTLYVCLIKFKQSLAVEIEPKKGTAEFGDLKSKSKFALDFLNVHGQKMNLQFFESGFRAKFTK